MDPRRFFTLLLLVLLLALAAPAAGHGLQPESGGWLPVRQGLRLLTRTLHAGEPDPVPHRPAIYGMRG